VSDVPPPPPPPPPPSQFGSPPPASSPDVGAALSYGWRKFQANAGPLIIAVLIPVVAQLVLSAIGRLIGGGIFVSLLFTALSLVVSAVAGIGIFRVALQITAGEPADIGKAYTYDRWGEWILFSIVFGLAVGFGLVLCIIPGLLVLAFFGLAPYFFLDGRMSLGDAFSSARNAASSKGLALPVLLAVIVGVLGVIACVVGLLVTEPVAYVAVAFLYRYAVGQPVAA
jgi:uncharacterized membrane protein